MDETQLGAIANSEAYFGLADTTDVGERTELLEQELAMRDYDKLQLSHQQSLALILMQAWSVESALKTVTSTSSTQQEVASGITETKRPENG